MVIRYFFEGSDWFAVALTASTEYRFKVLGNPSVVAAQQVRDTRFAIYGSTGTELDVHNKDNGDGPDSAWENETWTSTEGTGTYYVAVTGNDTGAYSLEVKTVDATLSALALTDGDGNGIDLSPTFAADEFSYTASVASDIAAVTVAGTANQSAAIVTYSPVDADDSSDGHQGQPDGGRGRRHHGEGHRRGRNHRGLHRDRDAGGARGGRIGASRR